MTAGPPAGDDGRADARLAASLRALDGSAARLAEAHTALAGARVFLALTATRLSDADAGQRATGRSAGSGTRLSLLGLVSGSGSRALPAFLDGEQVTRWRPEARPLPLAGPMACRAVLDDGADALLVDPAGAALVVRGPALTELAAGRVPVAGAALSVRSWSGVDPVGQRSEERGAPSAGPDAEVPPALLAALGRALQGEQVSAARVLAGPDGPVLAVQPRIPLTPADQAALADRVRARLGADLPSSGLDLAVVPAVSGGQPVPLPLPLPLRRAAWRHRLGQRLLRRAAPGGGGG